MASGAGAVPVHFVLGTGRCGSTLVHEILCQHPSVGFLSNLEDRSSRITPISRFNGPLYRRLPPEVTRKGRVRFAPSEGYVALSREVSPLFANSSRDLLASDVTPWLADRLRHFVCDRAEQQGQGQEQPVFLHKLTGWPRAGLIQAVLPEARFVNVVRDGRAVANSWLQMPWWLGYRGPQHWNWGELPSDYQQEWEDSGRSFVVLAGLAWKLLIDAADEARAKLPAGSWIDVRYEDIVADPAGTMTTICDFFGLPPSAEFSERLAQYDISGGRAHAFVRDLGPEAVAELDRVLAGHLRRFGYDPV